MRIGNRNEKAEANYESETLKALILESSRNSERVSNPTPLLRPV